MQSIMLSPKNSTMASFYFLKLFYATLLAPIFLLASSQAFDDERKVYIVYMGSIETGTQSTSSYHYNMLEDIVDKRFIAKSLVRSYTRSFSGFAAKLTEQEQKKLASHEDVVSIFPSTMFYPQTTRSWEFMGMTEKVRRNPTSESDIIIGVIDTGIWPESQSFSDEGFGPPPKKWKGACNGGNNFTCNNKLIGARHYAESRTARDTQGHGSHTSSTAAGNYVKGVSFNGIAEGTARGGVPSARIAAYKACGPYGCASDAILAAFDDAIADGVDIITISIGVRTPFPLVSDPVAIGSMHATQKGILVTQSAGNSGVLGSGSIQSTAPWIFSVAASTTDRGIVSNVSLGNGTTLIGKAVNSFHLMDKAFPLIYGKDAASSCSPDAAMSCEESCLDSNLVKGKFVLCDNNKGIEEAFGVGALGAITQTDFNTNVSFVVPFPTSKLSKQDFKAIESYYYSKGKSIPAAKILASESIKILDAPRVASFSSRGPNSIVPNILKPDITAPGVEILAAYSPKASPSTIYSDKRSVNYSILSGTSMACPHVAGAAAYVKSIHPNWSSSAIKSALMTTAWRMNAALEPFAEFAYGAGHIDPVKAADPGLVYETPLEDYVKMLCSLDYDISIIKKIFGGNTTCPSGDKLMVKDLNYPSMAVQISKKNIREVESFSANFTRTVTNVGSVKSTYDVTTSKSSDYSITVSPNKLTFEELNEKKSFQVVISGTIKGSLISASIEWSDGVRKVRSPIVVY